MKLCKGDLVKAIAEYSGQTQTSASEALDAVFGTIRAELVKGNSINIPGFGQLEVVDRKPRTCINPVTKEKMTSAAKKAARMKFSAALNTALNQ